MKSTAAGVTLIELMIVVVILGIIAAIAIPGYRSYVVRSNRSDAKTAILAMAGQLERCFTRYNAYDDANCDVPITNVNSSGGHYRVTAVRTASTFSVTATPVGTQGEDPCGSLTLTSSNVRTASGTGQTAATCWQR
jgi:type IV pilus assembly protein PilE